MRVRVPHTLPHSEQACVCTPRHHAIWGDPACTSRGRTARCTATWTVPAPQIPESKGDTISLTFAIFLRTPAASSAGVASSGNLPVLLWFHGGGHAIGSSSDTFLKIPMQAFKGKIVIASVNYRMAPDHPYPAAADDCIAAVDYFAKHASKHGGDPDHLCVGGPSAGGNLAAVALHHAVEAGIKIRHAALFIPEMHVNCGNAASYVAPLHHTGPHAPLCTAPTALAPAGNCRHPRNTARPPATPSLSARHCVCAAACSLALPPPLSLPRLRPQAWLRGARWPAAWQIQFRDKRAHPSAPDIDHGVVLAVLLP